MNFSIKVRELSDTIDYNFHALSKEQALHKLEKLLNLVYADSPTKISQLTTVQPQPLSLSDINMLGLRPLTQAVTAGGSGGGGAGWSGTASPMDELVTSSFTLTGLTGQ